jgi:hypothetical protein
MREYFEQISESIVPSILQLSSLCIASCIPHVLGCPFGEPITSVDIARLAVSEDLRAKGGLEVGHVVRSVHHDRHHDDLLEARLV